VKIMFCDCKHPFQDALYGQQNRAANWTTKGAFRCTVCGRDRTTPKAVVKTPEPAKKKGKKK
jgi:hypothetical protein